MKFERLTLKEIQVRPVVVKLNRPVVARIATMDEWPLILIDIYTNEGIVGRSYLEPYVIKSMRYLVPALHDLGAMLVGSSLSPVDLFERARKSLHFVGYEGLSMIAVSGLDMAIWDALAKAADMPLCVFLGGDLGSVRAYNSNGLWLKNPQQLGIDARSICSLSRSGRLRGCGQCGVVDGPGIHPLSSGCWATLFGEQNDECRRDQATTRQKPGSQLH